MASLYKTHRNTPRLDPFIDLLFNALMGFSFLFLVSLLFVNPKTNKASVEKHAEFIISATWPENLADDIDLWVRAPSGHTASYLTKEAGWLHLERDDRGELNDTLVIDGKKEIHPINQEIVTIRNRQEGEYVVNLYYYTAKTPPLSVVIRIDRINPKYETVFSKTVNLTSAEQELTVVRFTVKEDGSVHQFNNLETVLTPYALEHIPTVLPAALYGNKK